MSSVRYIACIPQIISSPIVFIAPDFDYDSITSSDEAADKPKRGEASQTERIPSIARRSSSVERQEKKVSDKVCGLLGLPKDEGARKLNRGIMSKDTELQLRNLLKKEQNPVGGTHNNKDIPATPESDTSDDSTQRRIREDQRWEAIRQRRLLKRQSSKSIISAQDVNDKSSQTNRPVANQDQNTDANKTSITNINTRPSTELNQVNFSDTEDDDSSQEDYNSRWGRRHSTAAAAESLSFVRNKELPKRGLPPKNTCPIQQVEKDDDGSVFTNFGRSFRNLMARNTKRDSTSSASVQSMDDNRKKRNSNRDSKSSSSSRKDSRFAAFLGWHQPAEEVTGQNDSFDEESSDDEDAGFGNNILSEGEYYLAMSMLVYMYALLRETAMLGHTVSSKEIPQCSCFSFSF